MIDTNMLEAGQEFSDIHDSYVIFITENDILGQGLPLYHINRIVEDMAQDMAQDIAQDIAEDMIKDRINGKVKRALEKGKLTAEEIAEAFELPLEEVLALAPGQPA